MDWAPAEPEQRNRDMHRLFLLGLVIASWLVPTGALAVDPGGYWRFESGSIGSPITFCLDESGRFTAHAGGTPPVVSADVPMAVIPLTGAANHASASLDGGYFHVPTCPQLSVIRNFTVEMWAKFGALRPVAEILASKGTLGPTNWHFLYQVDGTVQANIYGGAVAYLFDAASGGPVPGVWYHLAATYEDAGGGRMRIHTFVNGHPRGIATGSALQDTSGTDLYIGSYPGGQYPFHGLIDEFRFTPSVLKPEQLLIAGTQPIPEMGTMPEPMFVPPGTVIDDALRAQANGAPVVAQPNGYRYFYTTSTGGALRLAAPPSGYDIAFNWALQGWSVMYGGSPAGYHIAVRPGQSYVVAVGFYDPSTELDKRVQRVVIDGHVVDTIDPAAVGNHLPFVRKYEVADYNGDGYLDVTCTHFRDECGYTGMMSVIWIYSGVPASQIDTAKLLSGNYDIPPIYYISCGRAKPVKGHVSYPDLTAAARAKMLPMRKVPFDLDPNWPQPADPLDIQIRGELADRINTYMDRWAYIGRDQQLVATFLSDGGYETHGRFIDTYYKLGRLMHKDFNLQVPFEAILAKQDSTSRYPGGFVGGSPLRTGFLWGQGCLLSAMMSYYDMTGDQRALDAACRLGDFYQSYLNNGDLAAANYLATEGRFTRDGATVGHLGKGSLEAMAWLYWRTKNTKYLDIAKQMAALNRQYGGVAWMIYGDGLPSERRQYESWHIHANLTTVRGFPWLYAATGDVSYLNDAIAACDRIAREAASWGTGGVLEQIPWADQPPPDPHDEICQTSDELQLSYLLADFTKQGRFLDRAEQIYYNHIRFSQYHYGDFCTFNRLPGMQRGGDGWFCCGWWGGKALYETARHLYASSPNAVYINGFMPSSVSLKVGIGTVKVDTEADIPRSGDVCLTLNPVGVSSFTLNIRVPGWAQLLGVEINGSPVTVQPVNGYVAISRSWKAWDRIKVRFDLSLRVAIDSAWDTLPTAKVSVDGAPQVDGRCVSVFRGPAIVAQFRLAHGCDLDWIYTGDHPDLLDSLNTSADAIDAGAWRFESESAPALTTVTRTANGVRLQWSYTPAAGWTLNRTALVRHPELDSGPVRIDYTSELIAPDASAAAAVRSARACGVRMRTSGFVDYTKARLLVDGAETSFFDVDGQVISASEVALDNGYVRFALASGSNGFIAADEGGCANVYVVPKLEGNKLTASCTLTATGQSQWAVSRQTYYVAPDGSDANDGLSETTAWAHIEQGDRNWVLKPGSTVMIKAETYRGDPAYERGTVLLTNCSGEPGEPIVYEGYGGRVIIDRQYGPDDGPCWAMIVGNQTSALHDLAFDGLEFTGAPGGMLVKNTMSAEIRNCRAYGSTHWPPEYASYPAILLQRCGGNTFVHNNVVDVSVGRGIEIDLSQAGRVEVHNNTIYQRNPDPGGYAFWIQGVSGIPQSLNGISLVNNIFWSSGYTSWCDLQLARQTHNLFWDSSGAAPAFDGAVPATPKPTDRAGDPVFVDPASGDLRLSETSPAIDAGTDIGLPFDGLGPDIGALEGVVPATVCAKISDLRNVPAGTVVRFTSDKTVTVDSGAFAGRFIYAEEPDRSSGIRVVLPPNAPPVREGDLISLAGRLSEIDTEPVISATSVTLVSGGPCVRPLGLTNRSLSTPPLPPFARGGEGGSGSGLSAVGLLVEVWGRVTEVAGDHSAFYIDDGCLASGGPGQPGLCVSLGDLVTPPTQLPSVGDWVSVVGVAGYNHTCEAQPVVRPRQESDIAKY